MNLFNWKTYSIAVLRRASYRTPMRSQAMAAARVGRGLYLCAECVRRGIKTQYKRREVHVDHIQPCVAIETGWTNLDDFAARLFCESDGLQCLCILHHKEKTKAEKQAAAAIRQALKKEKQ